MHSIVFMPAHFADNEANYTADMTPLICIHVYGVRIALWLTATVSIKASFMRKTNIRRTANENALNFAQSENNI